MDITLTFLTISSSVIKLFILVLIGVLIYRAKLIDNLFLDRLSLVLLYAAFPALIISKTILHFNLKDYPFWWMLPIIAIFFALAGAMLGAFILLFLKTFKFREEFICSVAFQNAGYLPMNLIAFSFSGLIADRLLIYLFLFLAGFNFIVWTFIPFFLRKKDDDISWKHIINPPVLATIFSILWVIIVGPKSLSAVIIDPLRQLGQSAFPLAMITLGGYLCRYRAHVPENKVPLAIAVMGKLVIFPAMVFTILCLVDISMDYKFFIFLESVLPTAVSLVIIIGLVIGAYFIFI